MRKKQNTKTVEFSNLPEDHKAEFIHFLIKNNICFQEGKENCTAQVSIKPNKTPAQKPLKERTNVQPQHIQPKPKPEKDLHSKTVKVQKENATDHVFKQLKTPTKDMKRELRVSSLSCKGRSSTIKKPLSQTPRSVHKPKNKDKSHTGQVKEYDSKDITSSSKIYIEQQRALPTKQSKQNIAAKEKEPFDKNAHKPQRKVEVQRQRVGNKYANLFDLGEKGRAIRWPINMLERAIEEIYDDIFTKNTQCLQNKNIGTAIKTLTLTSFSQLVEGYFRKKFKGSKLTATNLNNMLFSLSYYITRENCPIIVKTFQDFLVARLHHEDLLYYLFARSILKKELRVAEKLRDCGRSLEGSYFIEGLKARDIGRYLRGIIGKDSDLLNQYKHLIVAKMQGEQINAYHFLRILLEDYHSKRLSNGSNDFTHGESFGNTLFEVDCSYEHNDHRNTEELTFGEEPDCSYEEEREFQYADFWNCHSHSRISDSLYDLIIEKMEKKVVELIEILIHDTDHHPETIAQLEHLLLRKSESMVTAIFEMNKMKWFKELNISSPSEEDMNFVEGVQIRLRELRESPTGKDIGEFCKNILTTKALVNELELSLMMNN